MKQIKPKTLEELHKSIKPGDLIQYDGRVFYFVLVYPKFNKERDQLQISVILENEFRTAVFFDAHLPATTVFERDQK